MSRLLNHEGSSHLDGSCKALSSATMSVEEMDRGARLTRMLVSAIAILLAVLTCLTSINFAFAYFIDTDWVLDDFSIAEFQEPAYACVYGDDVLAFGRGEPEPAFEGRAISAVYRGMEDGTEDFAASNVGDWTAANFNSNARAPWSQYLGKLKRVVSVGDEVVRPLNMQKWFCEPSSTSALVSVDLSGVDTSKCQNMAMLFYNCKSLRDGDVADWDMSSCRTIAYMFASCTSLEALDVSNWNVERLGNSDGKGLVQSIIFAFSGCSKLETIDTSKWSIIFDSTITGLSLFSGCSSLKEINISGFRIIGNKQLGNTGYATTTINKCTSLEKMTFPSSFMIPYNQYIGCPFPVPSSGMGGVSNSAFWYIEGTDTPMTNVEAYNHQVALWEKQLKEGTPEVITTYIACREFDSDDAWAALYGNSILVFGRGMSSDIPASYEGCDRSAVYREIESTSFVKPWPTSLAKVIFLENICPKSCASWFEECRSLCQVSGMEKLLLTDVVDMRNMFANCRSLSSIDVSVLDTSHVTNMSSAFELCTALEHLDISNWDMSNVTTLSRMFYGCSSLKRVELPDALTLSSSFDIRSGMFYMFAFCESLAAMDLSGLSVPANWMNATAGMFLGCKALESITVPATFKFSGDDSFPNLGGSGFVQVMWRKDGGRRYTPQDAMTFCNSAYGTASPVVVWTKELVDTESYAAVYGGPSRSVLVFGREGTPDTFNGMELLERYTNIENDQKEQPWALYADGIDEVICAISEDLPRLKPISMHSWFKGIRATSIDLSWVDTSVLTSIHSLFYGAYLLEEVIGLGGWDVSKVVDANSAFAADKLKHVDGIEEWSAFHPADVSWMFWSSDIQSLDISAWSCCPSSIAAMFYQCAELVSLSLPPYIFDAATSAENMFWSCAKLHDLALPVSIAWTSKYTNFSGMFNRCSSLESIQGISDWDTSHVVTMDGMFHSCFVLKADCSKWNVGSVASHDYTFNYAAPGVVEPSWVDARSVEVLEDAAMAEEDTNPDALASENGEDVSLEEIEASESIIPEIEGDDAKRVYGLEPDADDGRLADVNPAGSDLFNMKDGVVRASFRLANSHPQINMTVKLAKSEPSYEWQV